MAIPAGYNRHMSLIYRGADVTVRLLGTETIDFTSATGAITRTETTHVRKALVGPETKAAEGHTRTFTFLSETYPEDPPSTTTRLDFGGHTYEIKAYSTSADGRMFDLMTIRL